MNKIVGVRFYQDSDGNMLSPKTYAYKTNIDFEINDLAVVQVNERFSVVLVSDLDLEPEAAALATKWIIQKVDLAAHKERLRLEKEVIQIKKELAQRRAKVDELATYRMIAQYDPATAQLLAKLEALDPSAKQTATELPAMARRGKKRTPKAPDETPK